MADVDVDSVPGAFSGGGSPGGQPEDDEEAIEGEDGDDVVGLVQGGDFLRDDDVGDNDPGEQTLWGKRKKVSLRCDNLHQVVWMVLTIARARPSSSR